MECPRCGLINPDSAQRCDCGYDFQTQTVERPYFKQELTGLIKSYLTFVFVWNGLGLMGALATRNPARFVGVVLRSAAVYPTYLNLVRKKPWAGVVLMVLTFPIGTLLLSMREVKLYMLQQS